MNPESPLSRRLAAASHDLRAQHPAGTLLPAIHRRLNRGRWRQGVSSHWLSWFGWAGLSTATVALAAALVVNSTGFADDKRIDTVADADGFVRLVSQDEWQRANAQPSRTWLVSTELSQSRLAAFGLPYDPSRAGERVPAQLILHSSGEVLAVRLDH